MQQESSPIRRANYFDFDLEIGLGAGRDYPVAVLDSPAGKAHATMHFPFDELALDSRLDKVQIALLRSGGQHRRIPSPEEQAVQQFGQDLFAALFDGDVRSCYDISLRDAAKKGMGLRLRLRIHPPELGVLPWEFMYDPRQAEFVCLSRRTPIIRYLETPHVVQPLTINLPLRVLGMVASPSDLRPLDVDREKERVERAIGELRKRDLVQLAWLEGGTWRDLQEAMWGGPWHIFHFIGHGGFDANADEGFIALVDAGGQTQRLSATLLGRLLADHDDLRLVLLNTCEGGRGSERDVFSSTASILMRRGIPAVLAMQYEITDRAAIEFARAFYRALAHSMPVDEAAVAARKAISLGVTNTVEWGTPVLFLRAPDGVLFQMADSPPVGRPGLPFEQPGPPTARAPSVAKGELEELYIRGLGAFWTEAWDEACQNFEAILIASPGYRDVELKLAEARLQRELHALYIRAQAAREAEDWSAALAALEELAAQAPNFRDTADLLETTRTQVQLADLYGQAQQLGEAQEWPAVANVLAQIAALDPEYPDPDGLRPVAEQKVQQLERQAALDDLYRRIVLAMEAGRWAPARDLLAQLQGLEPDYRGAARLQSKVDAELAREEAERRRQEQIAALYAQAAGLAGDGQWAEAQARLDEVRALDASFADPDGIAATVRQGLEQQEQLDALYARSRAAREAGDWTSASAALEELLAQEPDNEGAATLLEEVENRQRLSGLYAEAEELLQVEDWLGAAARCQEILTADPGYQGAADLLARAQAGIARQGKEEELARRYDEAVQYSEQGDWEQAARAFAGIVTLDADYRDAAQRQGEAEAALRALRAEPEPVAGKVGREEAGPRNLKERVVSAVKGIGASWRLVLAVLPALLLLVLVAWLPMLRTLFYSFLDSHLFEARQFVGLQNYADLLGHPSLVPSLRNALGLVLVRSLAVLAVWWLLRAAWQRRQWVSPWLVVAAVAPLPFLTPVGTAMNWQILLRYGPLAGWYSAREGLWLSVLALDGIHTLAVAGAVGLLVYALAQKQWDAESPASQSTLRSLRNVMLLLAIAGALQSFNWSYVIYGDLSDTSTPLFVIYRVQFIYVRPGVGAAYATLLLAILIPLAWVLWKAWSSSALRLVVPTADAGQAPAKRSKPGPALWFLTLVPGVVLLLPFLLLLVNPTPAAPASGRPWGAWLLNSLVAPALTIWLVMLPLALLAAYAIVSRRSSPATFSCGLFTPLALAAMAGSGLISAALFRTVVGLDGVNTLWATALPLLAGGATLILFVWLLDGISPHLAEARSQGQSHASIVFRIVLPKVWPVVVFVGVAVTCWASQRFLWPLIVLRSQESYTLSLGLYDTYQRTAGHAAALVRAAVLPLAIPFAILLGFLTRIVLRRAALLPRQE